MIKRGAVSVITRTKNRSALLKRAIDSVVAQTYPHWEMIVVNDGGDVQDVEQLLSNYPVVVTNRIRVVNNALSLGMESASAIGLAQVEGDLITVHDDDDSWAPEFLSETVSTLRAVEADYTTVAGVATYSNRVWEQTEGYLVHTARIEPFNDWIPAGLLSLDQMLAGNILPPISFLFTREAFERLGSVYERIPYLGDWDFLIRFMVLYDIYMIPKFLAFYHWRIGGAGAELSNSVTEQLGQHQFYRQLLLNEWLRQDLAAGRFGIGAYANLRNHLTKGT